MGSTPGLNKATPSTPQLALDSRRCGSGHTRSWHDDASDLSKITRKGSVCTCPSVIHEQQSILLNSTYVLAATRLNCFGYCWPVFRMVAPATDIWKFLNSLAQGCIMEMDTKTPCLVFIAHIPGCPQPIEAWSFVELTRRTILCSAIYVCCHAHLPPYFQRHNHSSHTHWSLQQQFFSV